MNCPNCGVPLMGGMKVCPKCKYDTRTSDGGALFAQRQKEQSLTAEEKEALLREEAERERERKKEEEQLRLAPARESVKRFSGEHLGIPGLAYRIKGARGRSIDIYPFKVVITTDVTLGSVISSNATDGEKTIYFQDVIGLQVKYPGLTLGFIQFETAAATQNNSSSNFFNENPFTYDVTQINAEEMSFVVKYVKDRLDAIKEAQRNSWMK